MYQPIAQPLRKSSNCFLSCSGIARKNLDKFVTKQIDRDRHDYFPPPRSKRRKREKKYFHKKNQRSCFFSGQPFVSLTKIFESRKRLSSFSFSSTTIFSPKAVTYHVFSENNNFFDLRRNSSRMTFVFPRSNIKKRIDQFPDFLFLFRPKCV